MQEFLPRDTAEAVSAGRDTLAVDEDVDVVPVREVGGDRAKGWLVGGAEVLKRLVGEYDAPSKSIVAPIPFEYGDVVRSVSLLEQERGVKSGRPTADDYNFQV